MDIELTNEAITKAVERCGEFTSKESNIRLGITGGGCAGYEYVIEHTDTITPNDNVLDYGKFKIVVDIETRPAAIRIYSKLKPKNKLIVVITKNEAKKLKKY